MTDEVKEVYYQVKKEGCFFPLPQEKAFQGLKDGTLVFSRYEFKSNPDCQVITLVEIANASSYAQYLQDKLNNDYSSHPSHVPVLCTIDDLMVPAKLDTSGLNKAIQELSDKLELAPAPKEKTMTKEEYVLKRALKEAEENVNVLRDNLGSFKRAIEDSSNTFYLCADTTEGRLTSLKEAVAESHPWIKLGSLQKDEDGDLFVTVDVQ